MLRVDWTRQRWGGFVDDEWPMNERNSRIRSWSIHLFTASGAVLGFFALISIATGNLGNATLLMLASLFIDAIDGTLARAAKVSEHVPQIDGRRLDDIVDYFNFAIVPANSTRRGFDTQTGVSSDSVAAG